MNTPATDPYDDREQTWVKHAILRQYLLRLAVIVGSRWDCVTYVDCFSGPWENQAADFSDTSFAIAIAQLRAARDKLRERDRTLRIRCLFIEKNAEAFRKLDVFAKTISDVEILSIHGELASNVDAICKFVKAGGSSNFPFIFIDPTGWTGFPMEKITPLLSLNPGEVLVNFMTKDIRRFIDVEEQTYSESFAALYGHQEFRGILRQTADSDREDVMVDLYGKELKKRGKFEHVVYTPVFQPQRNAIHFHLIYASRAQRGLVVFKEEERKAVAGMEEKRGEAQQRKRQSSGEMELFGSQALHDSTFYESMRERYLSRLTTSVEQMLTTSTRIAYDKLAEIVLEIPLVWESDLKELLAIKAASQEIAYEGFAPRQKVPKLKSENFIVARRRLI